MNYSALFKGFIALAIAVVSITMLYNGGYSASGAYELDIPSSFNGGKQYHTTTKQQQNRAEERTQKRAKHIVQKHLVNGSQIRGLSEDSVEDRLMDKSDAAQQDNRSGIIPKMTPSGVQMISSSDLVSITMEVEIPQWYHTIKLGRKFCPDRNPEEKITL